MPPFNTVPGLVPLKIYSGSTLLTTNVNLINFTGSGVTTTVGNFNNLTITIGGGTTVNTGSLLKTASFSNPNLTFTKGDGSTFNVNLSTLVPTSASYALSSSYSLTTTSASYALTASYANEISGGAPNYVVLWKTSSSLTSSAFYQTGSCMGLGTTTPSSSAKLQIESTTQGFLLPRMTNAQRTSIVSASIGLMVYCTDATEGLYINKSTGWISIL